MRLLNPLVEIVVVVAAMIMAISKDSIHQSSFRIGGSSGKVIEYKLGFNETFYNSTLPCCFAVTSGSCYDSSTGKIMP